jgi:hypothetical protein
VSLVGIIVHIDCNRVKVVGERQLHDEINANMLPRSHRNFLWLENSFEMLCRLIALALFPTQDVLVYK